MDSITAIKRRFSAIIVGISFLFIISLFYLTGLYKAIAEETGKIALSSIEEADNEEQQFRLDAISRLSDSIQSISISKSIGTKGDSSQSAKSPVADMAIFSQLIKEVKLTVHQSIDSIIPVNLQCLDSLIASNFKNKGLSSTQLYYSEIVDLNTGTVLASSCTSTPAKGNNYYIYEFDSVNRLVYKTYTSSTTESVLRRMSGILITIFLIIILLGYAFWYFIRTVVQLKTLEEMKSDFTNNMTHELKTPISVAYSAVDTLLHFQQGGSREKREKYLNICIEQLSRLHDLVEQILSVSMNRNKKPVINKENVALKPLFERIANQQKLKAGKEVETEINVHPSKLTVRADATHLNNIISNLVDNAIKHSPGDVTIKMESYMDGDYCILSVKDNGTGISSENQKLIFDKFYRVPQGNLHNVKGYGLGLFYVKTMVEQHDGEITVKSAPGKGAEFTIKIPAK
jgi:signal transduction histidine kinase